jgi:hypothetical protein
VGPSDPAAVTDSGSDGDVVLDFAIPQGVQGEPGAKGDTGDTGIVISPTEPDVTDVLWADTSEVGDAVLPVGGTTGQSLVKASDSDYDSEWVTPFTDDGSLLRLGLARPKTGTTTYYSPLCAATGETVSHTISGSSPRIRYGPAIVTTSVNISDALAHVNTAAVGATIDYYISDADADWQPIPSTARTVATGIDASSPGAKEITGLNITLAPGRYLIIMTTAFEPIVRLFGSYVPDASAVGAGGSQNLSAILSRGGGTIDDPWTAVLSVIRGGSFSPLLFKWTYA